MVVVPWAPPVCEEKAYPAELESIPVTPPDILLFIYYKAVSPNPPNPIITAPIPTWIVVIVDSPAPTPIKRENKKNFLYKFFFINCLIIKNSKLLFKIIFLMMEILNNSGNFLIFIYN